jgi:hypothetical protein
MRNLGLKLNLGAVDSSGVHLSKPNPIPVITCFAGILHWMGGNDLLASLEECEFESE